MEVDMEWKGERESLPADLLARIFSLLTSFRDLAQVGGVSREWREGVRRSVAARESLRFAGWKMDDDATARLLRHAHNLRELDISRSCWCCQITDVGLHNMSITKCVSNLTSISMWGMAKITDKSLIQLVTKATSLQHLNIGGTVITDESLTAIATSCPHLKDINLWSCHHVTEGGLIMLLNSCRQLESVNVTGTRVPVDSLVRLLAISPTLQIKPTTPLHLINVRGATRVN